ncbi:hypothetical protein VULLAG_LOCUS14857 [Vulpes lagopus]
MCSAPPPAQGYNGGRGPKATVTPVQTSCVLFTGALAPKSPGWALASAGPWKTGCFSRNPEMSRLRKALSSSWPEGCAQSQGEREDSQPEASSQLHPSPLSSSEVSPTGGFITHSPALDLLGAVQQGKQYCAPRWKALE